VGEKEKGLKLRRGMGGQPLFLGGLFEGFGIRGLHLQVLRPEAGGDE